MTDLIDITKVLNHSFNGDILLIILLEKRVVNLDYMCIINTIHTEINFRLEILNFHVHGNSTVSKIHPVLYRRKSNAS
jgi:hypothetical protein